MPIFRELLYLRCPSTISPEDLHSIGTANPNSRIDAHMRSTAASFRLGFRGYSRNQEIGLYTISRRGISGMGSTTGIEFNSGWSFFDFRIRSPRIKGH